MAAQQDLSHTRRIPRQLALVRELRQAYDARSLIICAGPGVPASVGLPSTEELAEELLARVHARGEEMDEPALSRWILEGRASTALTHIRRKLGAEFNHAVETLLDDRGYPVPPLARAIAGLAPRLRAVYTTNLDRLLERAFASRWPTLVSPRADLPQRRRVIFKLRGDLQRLRTWVLTREQEEHEFAATSKRRRVFEAVLQSHPLLFVGFGVGAPLLERLLEMSPPALEGARPLHFIILEQGCSRSERLELERSGLRVLEGSSIELLRELDGDEGLLGQPALELSTPYPGLAPFSESLADVFFGRHTEISEATSRIGSVGGEHRQWLAVEGPSGIGKSSFVHAGLVPALRRGFVEGAPRQWRVATMRPGTHPLRHLAEALLEALELPPHYDVDTLVRLVRESPSELGPLLQRYTPPEHGLMLILDQFEEILTLTAEDQRGPFGVAVVRALDAHHLFLVTTIRSDYVARLQASVESIAELLNERAQRYALPPISRVGLREAITEPALRLGVTISSELVEQIVADVETHWDGAVRTRSPSSALPLVAHMLGGLWQEEARRTQRIDLDDYLAVGGVMGALTRSADEALLHLSRYERAQAKLLLLGLVRVNTQGDDTRHTLTRAEAIEIAGGGALGERLLGRLSGAAERGRPATVRLLTVRGEGPGARVDLVHEALLRDWETYGTWIDENRRTLQCNDELARRARRWHEVGRPLDDLPRGSELRELLGGCPHGRYAELHEAYHGALRRAARHRLRHVRLRRVAVISSFVVVLVTALACAMVLRDKNQDLERERALSVQRMRIERGLRASSLACGETELEALELAVRAVGIVDPRAGELSPDAASEGLSAALACSHALGMLRSPGIAVTDLAFAPDGSSLATAGADGRVRLWDPRSGELLTTLGTSGEVVISLAYSPDGETVASARRDLGIELWDLSSGRRRERLDGHAVATTGLAFAPDGERLVTLGQWDSGARVWDPRSGHRIATLRGERDALTGLVYGPASARLVTLARDRGATLWDPRTGAEVGVLEGHGGRVTAAAFSSDGERLVTASEDHELRVWRADSGALEQVLRGHAAAVHALASSPRERLFASAGDDRTIRLWDPSSGSAPAVIETQADKVTQLLFAPDGTRLASVADDGRVELWDVHAGVLLATLSARSEVALTGIAFSPDGGILAASFGDHVRLWSTTRRVPQRSVARHHGRVRDLAVSPDGTRVVTTAGTHDAHVWDTASGDHLAMLAGHGDLIRDVHFSHDGSRIATASDDHSARLWDADDYALIAVLAEHPLPLTQLYFAPDDASLATAAGWDDEVMLWDAGSGAPVGRLAGHQGDTRFQFSHAGRRLATRDELHARIWSTHTAQLLATCEDQEAAITALRFAPGDDVVALAQDDGDARLCDVHSGRTSANLPHGHALLDLAFSGDGHTLATLDQDGLTLWTLAPRPTRQARVAFGDSLSSTAHLRAGDAVFATYIEGEANASLWDALSGAEIARLPGHRRPLTGLRFSPDRRVLTTISQDGTARAWRARDGELLELYQGHDAAITAVEYASGSTLVTASEDGSARAWSEGSFAALARACTILRASLVDFDDELESICAHAQR